MREYDHEENKPMVRARTQTKNWRKPRPLGECRKTPKQVHNSLNAIAGHFIRFIA